MPINVKQLLNYDKQTPARRIQIDEFLSCLPPDQSEDLTITISAEADSVRRGPQGWNETLTDELFLLADLPIYNSELNTLSIDKCDLGFIVCTDCFSAGVKDDPTPIHKNKLTQKGFVLGKRSEYAVSHDRRYMAVPTIEVFNYIADKINELIDKNEVKRREVQDSIRFANTMQERQERLHSLFD